VGCASLSTPPRVASPTIAIPVGASSFSFAEAAPTAKTEAARTIRVYTYLPAKVSATAAPIVFVMHGQGRNADGYRDVWMKHADKYGFMVVAPQFDSAHWGNLYASADAKVLMREGKPADPATWSYSVIERLFDAINTATTGKRATYRIYGHSEGAQFVHRLVWFMPEARYERAVAANAGWYTMPDPNLALPYGLAASPATAATQKQSLERKVVVLLGKEDVDQAHSQLRRTRAAMAQGPHRLARGENFFTQARERCAALQCTFGWQLDYVDHAAHSNAQMAPKAAALLMVE
jgi:poly(3-hydroxybutyrate) depolymerase